MTHKQSVALVPGSFDPITLGHLHIIERACQAYDVVYVAVMINDAKTYRYTMEQREEMVALAVAKLPNVRVVSSNGMLWELARDLGACAIVKGVRNDTDREYEEKMAEYNARAYPNAKTVLLECTQGLDQVSSTEVRNRLDANLPIEHLVPKVIIQKLQNLNT